MPARRSGSVRGAPSSAGSMHSFSGSSHSLHWSSPCLRDLCTGMGERDQPLGARNVGGGQVGRRVVVSSEPPILCRTVILGGQRKGLRLGKLGMSTTRAHCGERLDSRRPAKYGRPGVVLTRTGPASTTGVHSTSTAKRRDMEAKASKHASKCEHACARVRVCVWVRERVRARAV